MTDSEIQDLANRVIAALEALAPGPAGWWLPWTAWGSYAALIVAAVAFFVGLSTLKQKRTSDAKSEWWRRTQWALEATSSGDETMYAYGTGMLDILATSKLADTEDKKLLDAVWQGTDTEMQDAYIEQFVEDAQKLDLDEEDAASVRSFGGIDDGSVTGDNRSREQEGEI